MAAELSQLNTKQPSSPSQPAADQKKTHNGPFVLIAEIIGTGYIKHIIYCIFCLFVSSIHFFIFSLGLLNDHGKSYGIYAVSVCKSYESGFQDKWHIYRRYSDFYDLHQKIKEKVQIWLC